MAGLITEISNNKAEEICESAMCRKRVVGLTHDFYRYPARFPPQFTRAVIKAFTAPGDLVLDPFMGGGTTIVEAKALGRHAIGTDISKLATFVSRTKSTVLSENDHSVVTDWFEYMNQSINLDKPSYRPIEWIEKGYQKNINCKKTWPIRISLQLYYY